MNVTRFDEAPEYYPANHDDMRCLRLQGHEAGPSESLWLGVSVIAPGGHTDMAGSPVEKHYVVLDGSLTILTGTEEVTLARHDSVRIAPGEKRKLENRSTQPCSVLLAMPYPPAG